MTKDVMRIRLTFRYVRSDTGETIPGVVGFALDHPVTNVVRLYFRDRMEDWLMTEVDILPISKGERKWLK